jgi:hypothetical protein
MFQLFCGVFAAVAILHLHALWYGNDPFSDVPFEEMGSGRVGTWISRIDMIFDRDIGTNLLGSGPGSDLFFSPMWWWGKKYSHNDLLTTVIEDGFVGLTCILGLFAMIFFRFGRATLPVLIFFAVGSLSDGALMERPVPFVLYWIAVAIAAADPAPSRHQVPRPRRFAIPGHQHNLRALMLQSRMPPQRPASE